MLKFLYSYIFRALFCTNDKCDALLHPPHVRKWTKATFRTGIWEKISLWNLHSGALAWCCYAKESQNHNKSFVFDVKLCSLGKFRGKQGSREVVSGWKEHLFGGVVTNLKEVSVRYQCLWCYHKRLIYKARCFRRQFLKNGANYK